MLLVHPEVASVCLEEFFSVKVCLKAAVDFSVPAVILCANGKTVNNHPGYVFFALSTPLCAWVVFMCSLVESPVLFTEAAKVQELLAEVCC